VQPDEDSGAELLPAENQPLVPGLYLPSGVIARSTDHFAFIQSPTDCNTLTAILGAGEWQVVEHAALPIPSADPSFPMPVISPPEWLLLKSGEGTAFVRIGGDDAGCVAQLWRVARVPFTASGDVINQSGEASEFQTMCAAAGGMATFGGIFIADDGTVISLSSSVPLVMGTHPLGVDQELSMGQTTLDERQVFEALFAHAQGDEDEDEVPVTDFFPPDPESGWQGSAEVTSIDPLIATLKFEEARDESGDTQSLQIDFRCDLPPGQLKRAAENPTPTESPVPSGTVAQPNRLSVTLAEGPHAGTLEFSGDEITCSQNLFGQDEYLLSYSPSAELVPGDLTGVTVTVPASGTKTEVFITFEGEDFEHDFLTTKEATGDVTESATGANVTVTGHAGGTDFDLSITCGTVDQF
jgi:hypothetical protein